MEKKKDEPKRQRHLPEQLLPVTLLTIAEAAHLTRVSRKTFEAWLQAFPVKLVPVGVNQYRISYGELCRLIARIENEAEERANKILAHTHH